MKSNERPFFWRGARALVAAPFVIVSLLADAAGAETHAIDIPAWFQETFLDLRDDLREAAARGKRLMVYFGQDGCPYCRELMRANFGEKALADKTRARFDAVAINIWGDRDVTWIDGTTLSEKAFAARLKIQFTPTLLFLDEKGGVVLRINGYYPPHRFHAALEYASGKHENKVTFTEFARRHAREPASGKLHDQPFFLKPPLNLVRAPSARPLLVLFEQKECAACDELHGRGFADRDARALLASFDVARLELVGAGKVITPKGKNLTAAQWARELKVAYTPTLVFFDAQGSEIFRIEAYVKPFHLVSGLDYIASGAYRKQASFQRYLQARAAKIRETGGRVELW